MLYNNQALRINFNIGVNTSLTSDIRLKYRSPLSVVGEFTTVGITNASEGDVYVDIDNDVLTIAGVWTFWSFVTATDGKTYPGDPWQQYIALEGQWPVSKDYIKSYLGIADTSQDLRIDSQIPALVNFYRGIHGPFDRDTAGNTIYPPGMPAVIAEMYNYLKQQSDNNYQGAKTSEKIDDYSVSFGGTRATGATVGGFPRFIISMIGGGPTVTAESNDPNQTVATYPTRDFFWRV